MRRADARTARAAASPFGFSRAATSSVTFAPTAQLSTATSTAGPAVRLVVASDRQSPGLEPAGDSLRLGLRDSVAHQPDRIIRRDVHDRSADRHLLGRQRRMEPQSSTDATSQNQIVRRIAVVPPESPDDPLSRLTNDQ